MVNFMIMIQQMKLHYLITIILVQIVIPRNKLVLGVEYVNSQYYNELKSFVTDLALYPVFIFGNIYI